MAPSCRLTPTAALLSGGACAGPVYEVHSVDRTIKSVSNLPYDKKGHLDKWECKLSFRHGCEKRRLEIEIQAGQREHRPSLQTIN